MFARHTPTRMKGSGVLGWKSFVDKIHPQLPLTTKESQRLLTALTSSFRKHLDEAHPTSSAEDERKQKLPDPVAKPQVRSFGHSSASFADKHLASVLTNPLMKGGKRLDSTSAKIELTKNPTKDPIELLEEYHKQHAASVPIAELCLEHFMNRISSLTQEKQGELFRKHGPGRRVLLWLLESGFDNTSSYVDNVKFMDMLVRALLQEGREEDIWTWMTTDVKLADKEKMTTTARAPIKIHLHEYRWRGRLLRALIKVKLGDVGDSKNFVAETPRLHDALDVYLRACDIKKSAPRYHHLHWIPLGAARGIILKQIHGPAYNIRKDLDVERLDRYIDAVPLATEQAPRIYAKADVAQLLLIHPKKTSTTIAFQFWQDLFGDPPADDAVTFLPRIRGHGPTVDKHKWYGLMSYTISRLRIEGRIEQALWLETICKREFPDTAKRYLQRDIDAYTERYLESAPVDTTEEEVHESRVPFPTFA